MGTGYTRNDTTNNIADGNVINASDLDGEFDAVQAAFNASTGHSHDGTTGEGPQIDTAGLADDAVTGAKIDSTTTVTAASFVGPLTGDVTGNASGNAGTATQLQTARTIALSGDVTGSASFDGSANATITATVADDSHNHVVGNIDNFTESVQDIAGAMFSGNTESGITATYQDIDGTIDLDVNDPTISLTGAVTGSATMTNLGNVSIATTATSDPTLTLTGDVTGSATFTNLGNATLTATVADDSHNHVVGNIDDFTESVQDIAGAMFSGNTESGITATYQDADGTIDLNVNDPTISLTGAVTGSATMTNLGNVSITTTATSDPTLTLSGDLSGSATFTNLGNATLSAQIGSNVVGAAELNVSGNGTTAQFLRSDGDGSFSWAEAGGGSVGELNNTTLSFSGSGNPVALGTVSGFTTFNGGMCIVIIESGSIDGNGAANYSHIRTLEVSVDGGANYYTLMTSRADAGQIPYSGMGLRYDTSGVAIGVASSYRNTGPANVTAIGRCQSIMIPTNSTSTTLTVRARVNGGNISSASATGFRVLPFDF